MLPLSGGCFLVATVLAIFAPRLARRARSRRVLTAGIVMAAMANLAISLGRDPRVLELGTATGLALVVAASRWARSFSGHERHLP